MKTSLFNDTIEDIRRAARIIAEGGLIAFPTETVYGLGADAFNGEAVSKVYKAKGRPSDNPMIVHISSKDDLYKLAEKVTPDMEKLMDALWPGPMTMIVPAKSSIPKVTTGGLSTVGVRFPSDPVAQQLIEFSGTAIAAPSANLSGKPSPTTAQHVIKDMDGRIDGIIVSHNCQVGIESTVIDMTGDTPMILRPGKYTRANFEKVLGKEVDLDPTLNKGPEEFDRPADFKPKAPGMKYKHYSPDADMIIFEGDMDKVEKSIAERKQQLESQGKKVRVIEFGSDEEAARDLFAQLRQADDDGVDMILARGLRSEGLGFSVMNRMLKSAGFNIEKVK